MHEYTPEQTADFQDRARAFQDEFEPLYTELKKKHQCELVHGVITVPSESGIFGLTVSENIGDLKYKSVPSPLNESIIKS